MHIPTRLFDASGIIPGPSSRPDPIASFWFYNAVTNFAWGTPGGSVFPAPNPIAIANSMPHPVTVQQISKFQG